MILLRPWTRRQMSPSCGEPLKSAIKRCRNSKAFGQDKLFHLKHLGPTVIEYITVVTTCQIPTRWKSSLIIPKPGNLLSKINRIQLPPATAIWLSCYMRRSQDLLQRCKDNVYESKCWRPAMLQTVAVAVVVVYPLP